MNPFSPLQWFGFWKARPYEMARRRRASPDPIVDVTLINGKLLQCDHGEPGSMRVPLSSVYAFNGGVNGHLSAGAD